MDIRRNCVQRREPFWKNSVGELLLHPAPLSKWNYESVLSLRVSISQINRVRAVLGLSNHPTDQGQGKKRKEQKSLLKPGGKQVQGGFCC